MMNHHHNNLPSSNINPQNDHHPSMNIIQQQQQQHFLDPNSSSSSWHLNNYSYNFHHDVLHTNLPFYPSPPPVPPPPPILDHYPQMNHHIKREEIGLNLGHRTYFSSADALTIDRLLSARAHQQHQVQPPRCQAEDCKADLSGAKHYHRRHKVCEFHSKATVVIASGIQQRFCQQCSRFHVLGEFDEMKRSCRKRLADHNRRRRKPNNSTATSTAAAKISSTSTSSMSRSTEAAAATNSITNATVIPSSDNNYCSGNFDHNKQVANSASALLSLGADHRSQQQQHFQNNSNFFYHQNLFGGSSSNDAQVDFM